MNAQEKAKELLDKMSTQTYSYQKYAGANLSTDDIGWEAGKKCALICVEEMRGMLPAPNDEWHEERMSFLEEVKEELLKL